MFLAQAQNEDRSCQAVVNQAAVTRMLSGLPDCSTHTGAYCLLSRPAAVTHRDGDVAGLLYGAFDERASPGRLALVRTTGTDGGWYDSGHAGYGGQSGGLSPAQLSKARFGVSSLPAGWYPVPVQWRCA